MGRKEVLAERRALEEYYYNCKLETPAEVEKFFEVYTKLIWNFHQAGLVYDYYCDDTCIRHEGSGIMVGGVDTCEVHTIPSFAPYPRNKCNFKEIICVGDKDNGYRFGQVTVNSGVYSSEGATAAGRGDDTFFPEGTQYNFCQCYVNKVEGRWVISDEWLGYGQEVTRRRLANSQPFYETILGDLPTNPIEEKPPVEETEEEVIE